MSNPNQPRVQRGVTTAGRWVHAERAESDVVLITGVGTTGTAAPDTSALRPGQRVRLTEVQVAAMDPRARARLLDADNDADLIAAAGER